MFKDKFVTLPGELRVSKLMECDTFCLQYFDTVGWDRNSHRWRKEVWDGGKTTWGLGMGVPQRGPGVEPQ